MSQSLSQLYVHIIFHTKHCRPLIKESIEGELYAYMGAIIKDNQSIPIKIGGVQDHIHILCIMSKNIALAKLVEEVKRHSSRWIKTKGSEFKDFKWQGGYGGFSVSKSVVERVKAYIENQKEHHKKIGFKEEYLSFLKKYDVDFDEQYLWT